MFVVAGGGAGTQGEHGEHGGDADARPGRGGSATYPESDPAQSSDQGTGHKCLHDVHQVLSFQSTKQ